MEKCSNSCLKLKKRQHFNLSSNHVANIDIKSTSFPGDRMLFNIFTGYVFSLNVTQIYNCG